MPSDQYAPFEQYATPRELEFIAAIREHGSERAASTARGQTHDAAGKAMRRLRARAARQGYAPGHFESGTAPGFAMGKVTIQRAADGTVERTWERQAPDAERLLEGLRAAVEGMAGEIVPCAPVAAPEGNLGDLLAVYTLTDAHIGMLAWHREGGADWDLRIAEDTIVGCFTETIRQMPATGQAILSQLGDLLHYDGLSAVTPTSGHILDADGRFTKMVEVAVRVIRRIVAMLLAKHDRVHLVLAEGNHDMASSVWQRDADFPS